MRRSENSTLKSKWIKRKVSIDDQINKWTYDGYIHLQSQQQNLKWPKCLYEWRDETQIGLKESVAYIPSDKFKNILERLSYLYDVWSGVSWPSCGTAVFKNDHSSHVIWESWEYEFCWIWFKAYANSQHNSTCNSFRESITYVVSRVLYISWFVKLMISFLYHTFNFWLYFINIPRFVVSVRINNDSNFRIHIYDNLLLSIRLQ